MPTLIPHHLEFSQGLRLSDRGLTLEEAALSIPADTIFAALVDVCARSGEEVAAFVRPFADGNPPFLLTSAFPRVGGIRFYPVPVDIASTLGAASHEDARRTRQLQFLSEAIFLRALAGENLGGLWRAATEGRFLQQGALWLSAAEAPLLPAAIRLLEGARARQRPPAALREIAIWATERAPHVAVDRVQAASDIYYVGRTHFAGGCGLWFGVQWLTPAGTARDAEAARLARLLRILAVEGLGGKRSSGNGSFTIEAQPQPVTLPDAGAGRPAWLLSRVSPRAGELPLLLQDERARYRVTSVAGWMRSPGGAAQRRKRLALVAEGSRVVPSGPLIGQIVDVRPKDWPGHPVYRYGYGLAAGLTGEV